MDLNSIKLEPKDVALLFKNSLVEVNLGKKPLTTSISEPGPIAPDNNSAEWKYLGENKKTTLIVVRYPDAVHIPDKQLSFLTKLLAACNLNLGDVAILNFHHHSASDFNKILSHFRPKAVLMFNVEPGDFGMPMIFPTFQVQGYKDALYISSPSLEQIEPDKILKSKLWVCLKKIFNL